MQVPDFVWSTTHHLMQRSCSESLQTQRRTREVFSAPKMSGSSLVSQNPSISPCTMSWLKYWDLKRVESLCSTKWEQREKRICSILQFMVVKKPQNVSWGECCFSGEKGIKNETHEEKNAGPSSIRITGQVPPPACPHTENTKPSQFFYWGFRWVPQSFFFQSSNKTIQRNITHTKLETHFYCLQLLGIQKGIFRLK